VKVGGNDIAKFIFRGRSAEISETGKRNEHKLILIWNNPKMTETAVVKFYPQLVSEWDQKKRCKYFDSWETKP
jgi:hypothetical protein